MKCAEWYCRKEPEEECFYEIFFRLCQKYNVHWASATPKEKAFIEEVTRITYERDKAQRLGLPPVRSPVFLCVIKYSDPHRDPHGETSGRNTWSKAFSTSSFLRQKCPQSLIYQRLEGFLSLGKDEVGGSNPPSSSKKPVFF